MLLHKQYKNWTDIFFKQSTEKSRKRFADQLQTINCLANSEQKNRRSTKILAKKYNVTIPKLKVGLPKGHKKNTLGCYLTKNSTITVHNSDLLSNPHVILHEFYHHLRTNIEKKHQGTEKNANKFALDFIREYRISNQE